MSELEVVYDPVKEYAAVVDIDNRCGWGPAMVGPNAGTILQAFLDAMPTRIDKLGTYEATTLFQDWFDETFLPAAETAASPPVGAVEPLGGADVDETPPDRTGPGDGLSEPPEPQPADTDMEADQGAKATLVLCPLCAGNGVTADGEDGATKTCAMCNGDKVVALGAAS